MTRLFPHATNSRKWMCLHFSWTSRWRSSVSLFLHVDCRVNPSFSPGKIKIMQWKICLNRIHHIASWRGNLEGIIHTTAEYPPEYWNLMKSNQSRDCTCRHSNLSHLCLGCIWEGNGVINTSGTGLLADLACTIALVYLNLLLDCSFGLSTPKHEIHRATMLNINTFCRMSFAVNESLKAFSSLSLAWW